MTKSVAFQKGCIPSSNGEKDQSILFSWSLSVLPFNKGICDGINSKSGKDSEAGRWYFDLKVPLSSWSHSLLPEYTQKPDYKSESSLTRYVAFKLI